MERLPTRKIAVRPRDGAIAPTNAGAVKPRHMGVADWGG
jgi:hypothetical protein